MQSTDDLKFLLETPLEELQRGAGIIQKHFCGNHIDLCTIIIELLKKLGLNNVKD